MATKTTTKQAEREAVSLPEALLGAVRESLADAVLVEKKAYSSIRSGSSTVGYLNSTKKGVRVDIRMPGGTIETISVEKPGDVGKAAKAMLEAAAGRTKKQPKVSKDDPPAEVERLDNGVAELSPIPGAVVVRDGREAKPDPKPARKPRARKGAAKK